MTRKSCLKGCLCWYVGGSGNLYIYMMGEFIKKGVSYASLKAKCNGDKCVGDPDPSL